MKLILHIGTAKTGTTTLQNWFYQNFTNLKLQGVYYPKTLGKKNHWNLSIFAVGYNQTKLKDYEKFASNLMINFEDEYTQNSQIENWVISNEHLHSRLISVEMVEKVKKFLGNKFANIEVLIHLRPQIDVAMSLSSTATRHGRKMTSNWFINEMSSDNFYNYNLLVDRWERVFGTDCITIVPFKRQPCMTTFLINKLDLEKEKLTQIERLNESLDWRTMALVNELSRVYSKKAINYNQELFLDELPYQERLSIGIEMAKQFQAKFEESNNQLMNRRKELREDDLTPDWKKYNIPANVHYLDNCSVFTEQLNYLIKRFNWEIKLEKCEIKLVKCEMELCLNNLEKASILLAQAQEILQKIPKNKNISIHLKNLKQKVRQLKNILEKP